MYKQEKQSMSTITAERAMYKRDWDSREKQNIEYDIDEQDLHVEVSLQAHEIVKAEGILAQYYFFGALEEYLNSPIEASLSSRDVYLKILAIVDRGVGKRTLRKLHDTIECENESIQYFFKLRCGADGISFD
ncbi:hypothetical protein [Sporosarcina sp. P34]|uniref:SF0329 family protein n=1 Tax=Sporosarcina sp. P34 TaxID=2048247 RepID=UPI001E47DBFB|nr:hypothetical protein [Sporosarcina sp. P34]